MDGKNQRLYHMGQSRLKLQQLLYITESVATKISLLSKIKKQINY